MYPAAFEYHAPASVKEALALLSKYRGSAKLLAGGHSLIPTMKLRLAQPKHLIDIGRLKNLSYIKESGDTAFLKKEIPFHDGGSATVYEHLLRAVRYLDGARGQHGLPLIGHADWN
ncbi:MAG: FAD binding domain-containing protein, partial [Candidatus Rokubacteria bacterium]|nr:FAD binding domain-containing protein [Candidatus Rokubacteria bacterium]